MNSDETTVGVALFGLGRIGRIHAKILVVDPRVEVRWIVEEFQEEALKFMARTIRLDNAKLISFKDVDQVWNDPGTLAIVVCTPTCTHQKISVGGLEAGKAVFCEKPLAPDLASVKYCYQKAEEKGQLLYCAFNRRFDPSIRTMRDRIKAGEIGQIHSIKTVARDPKLPPIRYLKESGDIYHDMAVHELDVVCWIVGESPQTVFAQGHAFDAEIAEVGDVDEATIALKFPSGVLATIELSREAAFGYDQRIEVHGSKGMLQTGNLRETSVTVHKENGATQDPILSDFPERYKRSYELEMAHFLDVVQGKTERVEVRMEDVERATRVSDQCTESVTKRQVVFNHCAIDDQHINQSDQ